MEITPAFKSEVFRPLVTIIIPGAFSIAPYIILTGYYIPKTFDFWDAHPAAVVGIVLVATIAADLILDDLGSHIETKYWDERLERVEPGHKERWKDYLALELKDELIAQRLVPGSRVIQHCMPPR